MINAANGIRYLSGPTGILVVAPHGPVINGAYQNDVRTGIIAEELHRELGCSVIINDRFFKPKGSISKDAANFFLDVFRIDHAQKVPGYLDRIRKIIESDGKTFVLWLHGIADDVAGKQGLLHGEHGLFKGGPSELHALIGYGQGGDPKTGDQLDSFSAQPATVEAFASRLCAEGMATVPTWREGTNFRGRDAKRLNQWFNQLGFGFDTVESIQLEIREKDFRDSDANAIKTTRIIAGALSGML
jgi:hypothetical protein